MEDQIRQDDHVVVEGEILEVGKNSQGELAYRIAFPNGAHFWIDAEHVEPDYNRKKLDGSPAWRGNYLPE